MTFTLSQNGTQLEVTTSGFTAQGLQDYLDIGDYPLLEEITFRNGSYDFDRSLTVSRGNIEIVGESEADVILNYTGSTAGSTLAVTTGALDETLQLQHQASKGLQVIRLGGLFFLLFLYYLYLIPKRDSLSRRTLSGA